MGKRFFGAGYHFTPVGRYSRCGHYQSFRCVSGKADKCTFCEHRVRKGVVPACVQTCEGGALSFGDLKDPNSAIAMAIAASDTVVLRPKKNTKPSFHYIGLEPEVQKAIEGMVSKGKRLRPRDLENDR